MKQKPLIFLFTCVYNDRIHINKLFESIVNQSANNFIYYLYDDGSSENYDDLFLDLQKKLKEKGIKSYFEKGKTNLGINKATEHCLLVLRDKFKECTHFVWINSDDWLCRNYIAKITTAIIRHSNFDLFIPNIYSINEKTLETFKYPSRLVKKSFTYLVDNFTSKQIYSHFVVNKINFLQVNPNCIIFDNSKFKRLYNDDCILFICSVFLLKSYFIKKPLSYFLIRNTSLSCKETQLTKKELLPFLLKYLCDINPKYKNTYLKTMQVVNTHAQCVQYVEQKLFNVSRVCYQNSKEIALKLKLNKRFLYPLKSSYILFYLPRLYYILHSIKKTILSK